jgi:hypothetical protein
LEKQEGGFWGKSGRGCLTLGEAGVIWKECVLGCKGRACLKCSEGECRS